MAGDVRGFTGNAAQQGAEHRSLSRLKRPQDRLFSCGHAALQLGQHGQSRLRGNHHAGAAVCRVQLTLHEVGLDEIIHKVRHDGPVDAQVLGQCQLVGLFAAGHRNKDLVAAGAMRELPHGSRGGILVVAHQDAKGPTKVFPGIGVLLCGHCSVAHATHHNGLLRFTTDHI